MLEGSVMLAGGNANMISCGFPAQLRSLQENALVSVDVFFLSVPHLQMMT
jgi:hypothetical protein